MKKAGLFFFLLLTAAGVFFQGTGKNAVFKVYENELKSLGQTILKGKTEEERNNANQEFFNLLEKALNEPYSYSYPFDSLTTIARLTSPDNTFKIYNWHLPKDDGTYEYFGFVQTNRKNHTAVYPLIDKSPEIKSPETKILDNKGWYGAHYYQIVFIKGKRNKYYTLLGWDGNDRISTKKVIDVISFPGKGLPKFGAGIFSMENKNPKRIIFEYSKEAVMSLKFNESKKQIIFDHLSPNPPHMIGQYQYYGPDFSFDALEFKKGKWEYIRDLDARNNKVSKDKEYIAPR